MSEPGGRMAAALDEVDLKLIAELKADGRASMRALAERVHISRAGCYTRVERLHREGVITGYAAVTDPRRLGQGLAAYVYLKVTQNSWRTVSAALKSIPEIEHGGLVSGDNDLILFVRTSDADSLRDLVFERLQAMPDVLSTHTVLVFDEL
ncbi:Lrp/AsnC family transcriptional regulator [Amycolatopsis carbonis]|uniref:Lrp/AsnC family transcriptional regulator n=1 Tax=Amycolatopsis carbonis TaxID=715471 RepID=A0A9Y2ILY2_9PSEU|nr:Lrp/AsnC family transcriptional regulator [Amycolatopsis sp. 2-15]WIX82537.1 Lrp/AsnC family transcriptional regulator [Amycolatopsis sp. 2-15]